MNSGLRETPLRSLLPLALGAVLLVGLAVTLLVPDEEPVPGGRTPVTATDDARCGDDDSVPYYELTVRNLSCAAGRQLASKARFDGTQMQLPGYECQSVDAYSEGATYRCVQGSSSLRFTQGG